MLMSLQTMTLVKEKYGLINKEVVLEIQKG